VYGDKEKALLYPQYNKPVLFKPVLFLDSVSSPPSAGSDVYEMKAILNHRMREYRVQWKADSSITWEPANNINDPIAVTPYYREREAKRRARS
jgi:hypothetical protein